MWRIEMGGGEFEVPAIVPAECLMRNVNLYLRSAKPTHIVMTQVVSP